MKKLAFVFFTLYVLSLVFQTNNYIMFEVMVFLTFAFFLNGIYCLALNNAKQDKIDIKDVKKKNLIRYPIQKHYNDMNRNEKRKYKRWLAKNDIWDGAVVIENLEKNYSLKLEK